MLARLVCSLSDQLKEQQLDVYVAICEALRKKADELEVEALSAGVLDTQSRTVTPW